MPVKIWTGKTPQHRAVPRKPSKDARGKGGSERSVLLITARSENLVQSPPCEPAVRQHPIDRGDSERQDPVDRQPRSLDPSDTLPKLRKKGSFSKHVLSLF